MCDRTNDRENVSKLYLKAFDPHKITPNGWEKEWKKAHARIVGEKSESSLDRYNNEREGVSVERERGGETLLQGVSKATS